MLKYKNFLAWWISVLLISTFVFWSAYFGYIETIWQSDVTMITSLISFIFVIANLFLGWTALQIDSNSNISVRKNLDTCWFISEQLMALGMLGTVIGLIHMLAINFLGTGTEEAIQTLLGDMWKAMGLALYTNAVGLVASIALKAQVFYFGKSINEP